MNPRQLAVFGCALGAMACPPPEVLYGPEIFDQAASEGAVPSLPDSLAAVESDGQLIQVTQEGKKVGPAPEALPHTDTVQFSGTVICQGCVERLVLHVIALDPTGAPPPHGTLPGGPSRTPLVSADVSAGPFSVPVPRVDTPVAIELLVDANRDGRPSMGERFVLVLDPRSPLYTRSDRTHLVLDASDRPVGRDQHRRR